ncbi:MAG: hypothetical protein EOO85_22750, partial [Pedobacter sp.]
MDTTSQIFIYQTTEGDAAIDIKVESESIWLTQAQIVDLFQSSKANISEHLKHIFLTEELTEDSTVRKFRTVQREGTRDISRERNHYNLDAIISVGYRVNSKRGTQFRIWANKVLKEYLIKGYALNEKRLKEQEQPNLSLSSQYVYRNSDINARVATAQSIYFVPPIL